MMDYGLSDAEERAVFGYDEDDYEDFEPDVDDQIKAAKEEPEHYRRTWKEESMRWWK